MKIGKIVEQLYIYAAGTPAKWVSKIWSSFTVRRLREQLTSLASLVLDIAWPLEIDYR
jgi:hypothetical protein